MLQSRTVTTGAAREHSPVVPRLPSLLQSFSLPRSSSVISSSPGSFALSKPEPRFWIWANVLSLDAPLVAVMWQALLARVLNVRLYALEPVVLALSVWLLYVVDHVFDAMRPTAAAVSSFGGLASTCSAPRAMYRLSSARRPSGIEKAT